MLDNFLLRIDFQPFNLIDLKIPVKVSKIIAEPTAIKSPYIGTNNKIRLAKM
jgi:hypothetical protein